MLRKALSNGAIPRQLAEGGRLLRACSVEAGSREALEQTVLQYLQSPSWEVRNIGIKLIPRIRTPDLLDQLLQRLADGSECGIVRRNAAAAVREAHAWNPQIEARIAQCLSERYWEIRVEALGTLAALSTPSRVNEARILHVLFGQSSDRAGRHGAGVCLELKVRERNFEVRSACAQALGALAASDRGFAALCRLTCDPIWIVRYQATVALGEVAARDERYRDRAADQIRYVRITPECLIADHPFRETLARLGTEVLNGTHQGRPAEVRPMYLDLKKGWNVLPTNGGQAARKLSA
jgi:hypothetical protein